MEAQAWHTQAEGMAEVGEVELPLPPELVSPTPASLMERWLLLGLSPPVPPSIVWL